MRPGKPGISLAPIPFGMSCPRKEFCWKTARTEYAGGENKLVYSGANIAAPAINICHFERVRRGRVEKTAVCMPASHWNRRSLHFVRDDTLWVQAPLLGITPIGYICFGSALAAGKNNREEHRKGDQQASLSAVDGAATSSLRLPLSILDEVTRKTANRIATIPAHS